MHVKFNLKITYFTDVFLTTSSVVFVKKRSIGIVYFNFIQGKSGLEIRSMQDVLTNATTTYETDLHIQMTLT